jgi:hypothetical protein
VNHTPSHIFSKSRLNGPEVGIKVAGNSPASTDGSSPVINAAEGSTVIYAAPGASIGHLAGIKPTAFGAEGGYRWTDVTIGQILQSNLLWAGVTVLGIVLLTRGRRT